MSRQRTCAGPQDCSLRAEHPLTVEVFGRLSNPLFEVVVSLTSIVQVNVERRGFRTVGGKGFMCVESSTGV